MVDSEIYFRVKYDLSFAVGNVVCLPDSSVLINPLENGKDITILKYDAETRLIDITTKNIKIAGIHNTAYRTATGFFFTN